MSCAFTCVEGCQARCYSDVSLIPSGRWYFKCDTQNCGSPGQCCYCVMQVGIGQAGCNSCARSAGFNDNPCVQK